MAVSHMNSNHTSPSKSPNRPSSLSRLSTKFRGSQDAAMPGSLAPFFSGLPMPFAHPETLDDDSSRIHLPSGSHRISNSPSKRSNQRSCRGHTSNPPPSLLSATKGVLTPSQAHNIPTSTPTIASSSRKSKSQIDRTVSLPLVDDLPLDLQDELIISERLTRNVTRLCPEPRTYNGLEAFDEGVLMGLNTYYASRRDLVDDNYQPSKTEKPSRNLTQLPTHIILEIIAFLPSENIVDFACCSKSLYDTARSSSVWRNKYYSNPGWKLRRPTWDYQIKHPEMDPLIEGQLDWAGLTRERRTLEERWVSASKAPRADTFRAHQSTIYCSFVHEDYIITGGRDQSIRFWKYRSRKDHHMYLDSLCIIKGAHRGSVLCMLADPADAEGQGMMVTGGSDGGVNVWALEGLLGTDRSDTANPKLVRALDKHDAGVLDLAWGPEDLISCSKDGSIRVWDRKWLTLRGVINPLQGPLNCIAFHPTKKLLATAGCRGKIFLWDLGTAHLVNEFFVPRDDVVACLEFCNDKLVFGDERLRIIDLVLGCLVVDKPAHSELLRSFVVVSDMSRIITGGYDKHVYVWTHQSNKAKRVHEAHSSPGRVLTVSATATKLVSGDDMGNLTIQNFGENLTYAAYFA